MNNEKLLSMDPYILLSWTNTKLRDEFDSLEGLCSEYGLEYEIIVYRLKAIGYFYLMDANQFKALCD